MVINKRWLSLGLSILAVFGVGGTAYAAVKCSKKADEKTELKDKIIAYSPAIIIGVGTSAAILGSHYISRKEIVALTASCAYLAKNRDKIESKIREKFGDDKLKEVRQEVASEQVKEDKNKVKVNDTPWDNLKWKEKTITVEYTGRGNERFLDWESGRQFYSSYKDVCDGIKKLNYDFHKGESVCWNDLYQYWGLDTTLFGDRFGWPANEDHYDLDLEEPIPFDIIHANAGDGEEEMYIIYNRGVPPMEYWMEV